MLIESRFNSVCVRAFKYYIYAKLMQKLWPYLPKLIPCKLTEDLCIKTIVKLHSNLQLQFSLYTNNKRRDEKLQFEPCFKNSEEPDQQITLLSGLMIFISSETVRCRKLRCSDRLQTV